MCVDLCEFGGVQSRWDVDVGGYGGGGKDSLLLFVLYQGHGFMEELCFGGCNCGIDRRLHALVSTRWGLCTHRHGYDCACTVCVSAIIHG